MLKLSQRMTTFAMISMTLISYSLLVAAGVRTWVQYNAHYDFIDVNYQSDN